jgi:hypothetical protein
MLGPIHDRISRGCIGLLTFVLKIVYNIKKSITYHISHFLKMTAG